MAKQKHPIRPVSVEGAVATGARATGASATGASAVGALAAGSLAIGALAVGAVAVGALAIGRLVVGRARFRRVEIGELVVGRLRIDSDRSASFTAVTRICAAPGKGNDMARLLVGGLPVLAAAIILRRSVHDPDLFIVEHHGDAAALAPHLLGQWLDDVRRLVVQAGLGAHVDAVDAELFRTIDAEALLLPSRVAASVGPQR